MARSRFTMLAVLLTVSLAAVGCSDSDPDDAGGSPTQPTSPTTPTTPSTSTFTVTGVVTEAPPTTFKQLDGVEVLLTDSVATTTNGQGAFTFTGVAAGTYTLRARRSGYDEQTATITLPGNGTSPVSFGLVPVADTLSESDRRRIGPDDEGCSGGSRPCARYDFDTHHAGEATARLVWSTSDANLDLVLECDGQPIEGELTRVGGVEEQLVAQVEAGRRCEFRVLHTGVEVDFEIEMTFPN
ncbi:MAG: carboxypeptidase regulatory-like domain-containing protein [Vicinamibacterales bacterium]